MAGRDAMKVPRLIFLLTDSSVGTVWIPSFSLLRSAPMLNQMVLPVNSVIKQRLQNYRWMSFLRAPSQETYPSSNRRSLSW